MRWRRHEPPPNNIITGDEYERRICITITAYKKRIPGCCCAVRCYSGIEKGEILALIGENGAGKSTLIKCCSGAVIPTSGDIIVNGKTFKSMTPQLAAENGIAIIYQEFNNVKELSAAENLFWVDQLEKELL